MAEAQLHDFAPTDDAPPRPSRKDSAIWAELAGAATPAEFCRAWLTIQCQRTPGAALGLILLESGPNAFAPAAVWPAGTAKIDTLRQAGESALMSKRVVFEAEPDMPDRTCIGYPVATGGQVHGAVVISIDNAHPALLQRTLQELHWGVGWLLSLVWQHRVEQQGRTGTAALTAMELLAAVQEHDSLPESTMAFCNELGGALNAERVALGLVKKRAVKLAAISHGAWFRKRSNISETIEAAMDEAYDQQVTILHPDDGEGTAGNQIIVQHARLSAASGNGWLLSVPVEDRGRIIGIVTLEREAEAEPFGARDVLFAETAAALIAPTIVLKQREERLVSGRIRRTGMDTAKALLGPRKPLAKALGIAAVVLLLFLLVPIAQFRIAADASLEGSVQRSASVPFSGFIARSGARAGDVVQKGQVLASLDDRDLRLDYARSASEVRQLDRRYRGSLAQHERAEMNLYGAQLAQAEAELRLIEYKLARVNITAPIAGVLVSGDVSQLVGSPVKEGEVLFEVAPTGNYRVVLQVEEGDVSYFNPGQRGEFAPTGLAGRTVPFTVTKLTSVTANEDGKNTFRVEASLGKADELRLRPGMEGIAKVNIDRRSRLWIWTRGMRDWLRLFFWKWTP